MIDYLLFGLFAVTLLGIARFHARALPIAIAGLVVVLLLRLTLTEFHLVERAQEHTELVHLAPQQHGRAA